MTELGWLNWARFRSLALDRPRHLFLIQPSPQLLAQTRREREIGKVPVDFSPRAAWRKVDGHLLGVFDDCTDFCIGSFRGLNAQSFDFYEPKTSVQAPVVVFVHGGAWVSRSKATYKSLGEALAQQGYCAAVVDYELAPKAKHPQQVDQLEMALQSLAKRKIEDLQNGSVVSRRAFGGSAHDFILGFEVYEFTRKGFRRA